MSAFNPMDGVTIAQNGWQGTGFENGTHYFKTAFPSDPSTDDQESQRDDFADARSVAANNCSGETGKARMQCIASTMRDELS